MTGPKNARGGLASEVRYWGNWVLEKVKAEIGDLYPLIPDPAYKGKRKHSSEGEATLLTMPGEKTKVPPSDLLPLAYLHSRAVWGKKPACHAVDPCEGCTKAEGRGAGHRGPAQAWPG